MQLSDQVCSLDLAKRLKELGVKQESLFSWVAYENPPFGICKESDVPIDYWDVYYNRTNDKCPPDYYISAFTCSELGEMLSGNINIFKHDSGRWRVLDNDNDMFSDEKLSNAMAKMLIYLLENGLMELPK